VIKRTGRPRRGNWPRCRTPECKNTTESGARGFCSTHYMAFRRGRLREDGTEVRPLMRVPSYGEGARCLIEGCDRRPKGRGLCTMHYQQWESGVDMGVEIPDRGHEKSRSSYARTLCCVPGCVERPVNRWMCSKHAQQRMAGIIDGEGNQLRELGLSVALVPIDGWGSRAMCW